MVCTIDGTTITAGTETLLYNTGSETNYTASAVLVESNKVFIDFDYWEYKYDYDTHTYNFSSLSLNGIICTVEGTEITVGSRQILKTSSKQYYGEVISVLVDTNKICLILEYTEGKISNLKGLICTIDGAEVIVGTIVELAIPIRDRLFEDLISVIPIDTNKVFITFSCASYVEYENNISTVNLYGLVCKVVGSEIIVEELKSLITLNTDKALKALSTTLIKQDELYITFALAEKLYRIICTIYGTSIEIISDMQLISNLLQNTTISAISSVLIDKNKVFIANGYKKNNENAYCINGIVNLTNNIKKANRLQSNILGIAKNSGTEGDTIKVIVPE